MALCSQVVDLIWLRGPAGRQAAAAACGAHVLAQCWWLAWPACVCGRHVAAGTQNQPRQRHALEQVCQACAVHHVGVVQDEVFAVGVVYAGRKGREGRLQQDRWQVVSELATAVCTTACLAPLEALVVLAEGMTEAAAVAAACRPEPAGMMPRKLPPGQLHAPFSMMCSRRGWLKELDRLFRPA